MDVKEELTLLLLYLLAFDGSDTPPKYRQSWKGYDFKVLDNLLEKGYINFKRSNKSIYILEEGLNIVELLKKKYVIE